KRDVRRIQAFIDEYHPKYVLLIYPHLYNCEVFLRLKLPEDCHVVGYFHDTFIEGQHGRVNRQRLESRHENLLNVIEILFVMNEGMRNLYYEKYNRVDAIALEHTFPEYDEYVSLLQDGYTAAK